MHKIKVTICGLIVLVVMSLSAVAFYYYHIHAPLIPLLVGLLAVLPMGYMIDELRRLFKLKKAQQSHHPPNSS